MAKTRSGAGKNVGTVSIDDASTAIAGSSVRQDNDTSSPSVKRRRLENPEENEGCVCFGVGKYKYSN